MKFIRNYKLSVPAALVTLLAIAAVAFGYFGVHTAFIDDTVAEARPTFEAPPVAVEPTEVESVEGSESAEVAEPADVTEQAEAPGEIVTEYAGQFAGTSRYDVSGDAIVLGNGTDQRFLRFESFESSNGPDLNVYLFNPEDPGDFIDLGDLKGNVGDQNYEIPAEVDLDRYSQVSIWCVRFSVGFGTADLAPAA